ANILNKIQQTLLLKELDPAIFRNLFIIALLDLLKNNIKPQISPFNKLEIKEQDLSEIISLIDKIKNTNIDEDELLLGYESDISDEDLAYNFANKIIEVIEKFLTKQKLKHSIKKSELNKLKLIKFPILDENSLFIIPGLVKKKEVEQKVNEQEDIQITEDAPKLEIEENQSKEEIDYNLTDLPDIKLDELEGLKGLGSNEDDLAINLTTSENIDNQDKNVNSEDEIIAPVEDVEDLSKINISYGDKTGLLEDFVDEISFTETEIELDEEVKEEIKSIDEDEELKSIIQIASEQSDVNSEVEDSQPIKSLKIFNRIKLWLVKRRINKKFSVKVKPPKEKKIKKVKDIPKELTEKIIVEPKKETTQAIPDDGNTKRKINLSGIGEKLTSGFSIFKMLTFQDVKAGIIFYFSVSVIFALFGVAYWYYFVYKKPEQNKVINMVEAIEPLKLVIIEKDDNVPADEYVIEEINQILLDDNKDTTRIKEQPEQNLKVEKKAKESNKQLEQKIVIKQMSAWSSYEKANAEVLKYKRQGYDAFIEKAIINGMDIFRVKVKIK
ncbi:MAG TPA: hypothetical protein P5231_05470, partial [Ignavibacteriales bacterium]|nr:hypothetical protein [Ignavibacteriales bacterium]